MVEVATGNTNWTKSSKEINDSHSQKRYSPRHSPKFLRVPVGNERPVVHLVKSLVSPYSSRSSSTFFVLFNLNRTFGSLYSCSVSVVTM